MEIVTASDKTYPKEVLEPRAMQLILTALREYHAEPWETGLLQNIEQTIREQLYGTS